MVAFACWPYCAKGSSDGANRGQAGVTGPSWFLSRYQAPAPPAGADASAQATFHAGVTNVEISPEVLENGQPVQGLTQSDFLLYDENQLQTISYFAHESAPLDLVLLLDISGSVRKYLREIAAIAGNALASLQPSDQVAVMLFSRNTWIEQAFTNDHTAIGDAIQKASSEEPPGSGTRLYAAVQNAARSLQDQEQTGVRRRAILAVTDNDAMSYDVHRDQALRALFDSGSTFSAIVVGPHPHPPVPHNASAVNPDFAFDDVFPLAAETGGEAIATSKPKENLAGMLNRLRERYLLVYAAPAGLPPNTLRHVRVELAPAARRNHPHAVVRARSGYYVNGPA
jgi:VWFA-related protein